MAWIYATHPESRYRDGARAVELLRPLAASADSDANLLDTLAAAYAEAGQFDEALQTVASRDRRCPGRERHAAFHRRHGAAGQLYKTQQPYRDQKLLKK